MALTRGIGPRGGGYVAADRHLPLRARDVEARMIIKRRERQRVEIPRFQGPIGERTRKVFSRNALRPASSSERESKRAAVSAGEMGCDLKWAQPAASISNATMFHRKCKCYN